MKKMAPLSLPVDEYVTCVWFTCRVEFMWCLLAALPNAWITSMAHLIFEPMSLVFA